MTPDLYTAWLTAGNNLQPVVDWTVGHWTGLVALAVAAAVLWVVWWSIHDDTRRAERNDRNDRIAAQRADRIEDRPEPAEPGSNEDDLLICLQILAATNNARKEDR